MWNLYPAIKWQGLRIQRHLILAGSKPLPQLDQAVCLQIIPVQAKQSRLLQLQHTGLFLNYKAVRTHCLLAGAMLHGTHIQSLWDVVKFTILPRYRQRRYMPGAQPKLNRTGKLTPPTAPKDTKFPSALHSIGHVYRLLAFFFFFSKDPDT